MQYEVNGNELIVNGISTKFHAPIYKAEQLGNRVIVLLDWQIENPFDFTNALYAVSEKGKILWQMQNVEKFLLPMRLPDPLEEFYIGNNKTLIAEDYSLRSYLINPKNGKILNKDVIKW